MKGLIGVVSLGCDKNRVDSEIMLANLVEGKYALTNNCQEADVIVINTCAFLQSARQEAIDTIIEMSHYKQTGNCKSIVVTGCLGQKYGDEIFQYLTESDVVIGINQYDDIVNIIDEQLSNHQRYHSNKDNIGVLEGERILTTLPHTAYLKIADGCDNYCSYCLIPYIRGRYRSRKLDNIVTEAKNLAQKGVKELILVAQDVTRYGTDLYGKSNIVELIQQLSALEGIEWIRLMYCYPELVTDELIEEIVHNDKVVNYLDIPLQHVDDIMLTKMNRRSRNNEIVKLFDKLKGNNIHIRSTFICGFPFETDATHKTVADFLKEYCLKNVGFFPYSREEGTSAYNMTNQVSQRKKDSMVKKLYAIQQKISHNNNALEIGKTYKCIIDSAIDDNGSVVYIGRSYFMSPEIDGCIYIHAKSPLEIGQFYNVNITNAFEYDLIGEVNNESAK